MTGRRDLDRTLPWMRRGTEHLLRVVDRLTDDELRAPSVLPGWTRAHVVGHVARNAEALTRLATWARTGIETPAYASLELRAAAIEESAMHPGAVLRSELVATAEELDDALGRLAGDQWEVMVRSAGGREIPAAEVPWMRAREVWLHAVDLDAGADPSDLPADVVDLLIDDVVATLSAKDGCPDVVLAPTDRPRTWRVGSGDGSSEPVSAPAALLAGWLTGRTPPERVRGPALPTWL